ncbi:MAG: hypothetical protein FRX49_04961 [Trebouxia sp. A1-2]|nr:MAG: hypothetical protein FRX49_04961 [Trebouxia sp. A1-2]
MAFLEPFFRLDFAPPTLDTDFLAGCFSAFGAIRNWKLWGDVNKGLCNEARLVGLYEGVTGDDSGGFLDLHQHIHLLQTGLHTQHTAYWHTSYLQANPQNLCWHLKLWQAGLV